MYIDAARCADPEADLITPDLEDGDDDVVADHDALVGMAGQHEHLRSPFPWPSETAETSSEMDAKAERPGRLATGRRREE